jgi:predicted TPR repeat methyltransferase
MYLAKDDFILRMSSGRSVLHLGCVGFTDLGHDDRVQAARRSLHWKLTNCAETVGIDRSADVIAGLAQLGIFDNIVAGDVERLDEAPIARTFEMVIAGDVIEHLSNPGRMLDGIKRFCDRGTRLILTTPNAFGAPNFLRYCFGRFREGDEHVMSFNLQNLATLLRRHGYEVVETHTCFQPRSAEGRSKVAFGVSKAMLRLFPRVGGTLLVVARVSGGNR